MWLMAPCLDPKPESPPQGKLMALVPRHCNCPWLKFRRSGCPSETLNASLCYHRVGERNRFATCYEKALEHLMGATESMTPDTVLCWLVSGQPWPQSHPWSFQGPAHVPLSHPAPALGPGLAHLSSSWPQTLTTSIRVSPYRSAFFPLEPIPSSQPPVFFLLFPGHELSKWPWQNVGKAVQGDSQALSEPFPYLLWDLCFDGALTDPVGPWPYQQRPPTHCSLRVGARRGQGLGRAWLPSELCQFLPSFPG